MISPRGGSVLGTFRPDLGAVSRGWRARLLGGQAGGSGSRAGSGRARSGGGSHGTSGTSSGRSGRGNCTRGPRSVAGSRRRGSRASRAGSGRSRGSRDSGSYGGGRRGQGRDSGLGSLSSSDKARNLSLNGWVESRAGAGHGSREGSRVGLKVSDHGRQLGNNAVNGSSQVKDGLVGHFHFLSDGSSDGADEPFGNVFQNSVSDGVDFMLHQCHGLTLFSVDNSSTLSSFRPLTFPQLAITFSADDVRRSRSH
jgi:hypothetical protein